MSIRRKLLILFLFISLIPLTILVLFNRYTFEIVGDQVQEDIQILLRENAVYNMQDVIRDFDHRLKSNIEMIRIILELQGKEIENALRNPVNSKLNLKGSSFGVNNNLSEIHTEPNNYFKIDVGGKKIQLPVSFKKQNFFITRGYSLESTKSTLKKLVPFTAKFHRLFNMQPELIFWMHVTFLNGLHTTYPGGSPVPANYNPYEREWFIGAKNNNGFYSSYPYVDASSKHPVITLSRPFYDSNGSFDGVVGLDLDLSHIFDWIQINPEWGDGAEAILLTREENQTSGDLKILAQMNYKPGTMEWDQPIDLASITSADSSEFELFKKDVFSGKSGVRLLAFDGVPSIWSYRGFRGRQVSPLLIIPYENFTDLLEETNALFWNKNIETIRYTAIFGIIVILSIIFISYRRSKAFTQPIKQLATAGNRLADGDFSTQVDIQTGDELQELGAVFNSMGPKLKEHEKMQSSLQIAREIQQRLLPKEAPQLNNFELAGYCKYSDETGGDYYDYISFDEIEPGIVSVILGDVTGHGIGAALLMASARSMLRNNIRQYAYDLSRILFEFNNDMAVDTDPDKFITLFYGLINDNNVEIKWATGGHDPAILIEKESDDIQELTSIGVPVGMLPDMDFEQAGPKKLKSGDIIVVGTDGIWEAENENEEMFGKERMIEVLKKNNNKSAQDIAKSVVDAVLEFTKPKHHEDDITIVVIKVK